MSSLALSPVSCFHAFLSRLLSSCLSPANQGFLERREETMGGKRAEEICSETNEMSLPLQHPFLMASDEFIINVFLNSTT